MFDAGELVSSLLVTRQVEPKLIGARGTNGPSEPMLCTDYRVILCKSNTSNRRIREDD
jgi:hypothetical protein